VIHHEVKNDLDKVKANLEETLPSCESMGGLVVSFRFCVPMKTQMMKLSLICMLHKPRLRNYSNKLGLNCFFATIHFEVEINKN
jgi:hypothetical protein